MNLTRSKKKDLLYVAVAAFFFLTACVLQTVDDYISDWSVKKTIALLTQYIFFGLLAYWTASVISRISDKSICSGIIVAIALMGVILFVRLLKYHVFYDGTVMRYLWYSYYIPHCLAPAVLLITLLGMGRKDGKPLAKGWYLLFLPAAALILLVFTNDLHEQVFSFAGVFQQNIQMGMGLLFNTVVDGWIVSFYRRIALRKVSHFVVSEKGVDTSRTLCYLFYIVCFKRSVRSRLYQNAGSGCFQRGCGF